MIGEYLGNEVVEGECVLEMLFIGQHADDYAAVLAREYAVSILQADELSGPFV